MNTEKSRIAPADDTAFEFDWDLIRSFLAVMDAVPPSLPSVDISNRLRSSLARSCLNALAEV